jgi:hypothetical protein
MSALVASGQHRATEWCSRSHTAVDVDARPSDFVAKAVES